MNKNFSKKAFSLIELSLVILIIGVLIVAIAQGSRLVAKSKLNGARALTQTSPVNDIENVSFWIESTSEESFSPAQRVDSQNIDTWNDLNTQATKKKNFARTTNDNKVLYKESGINSIPSVYFNGTTSSASSVLNIPVIITPSNKFTIFMVAQCLNLTTASGETVFYNGNSGANGYGYLMLSSNNSRSALFGNIAYNISSTSKQSTAPEIIMLNSDGTSVTLEINGISQNIGAPSAGYYTPSGVVSVGNTINGDAPWNGYISEVIFFENSISSREKKDVRSYLGKKYNIATS